MISIHALREEGDDLQYAPAGTYTHFYPRPPRGGRPNAYLVLLYWDSISIHALREEGDCKPVTAPPEQIISIHALREEGDSAPRPQCRGSCYFYPRPPRGGRRGRGNQLHRTEQISIHALREEGDHYCWPEARFIQISIHALREEGDSLL